MRKPYAGILAGIGAIFALRTILHVHPLLDFRFAHTQSKRDSSAQSPEKMRGGNKVAMRLAKKRKLKIRAKRLGKGTKKRR